jgi:hypothetical protein
MSKTPFRSFADREIGVSDTGSWRSQESRLFITGVPKSRNAKRRNPETGTSTKSFADREITPFRSSDTGSWRSQESRLFITGVPKSRNAKRRNPETGTSTKSFADREITPFRSSGYRELECRNTSPQECRNVEMPKCEKHLLV